MYSPIRKRCPKCKGTDIYKRLTLKNIVRRSRYAHVAVKIPNLYHCYSCGHEFDIPFIGPKN